jgi:hypothetical protein
MNAVASAVSDLVGVFRASPTKQEAHRRSAPILEQLSRSPEFMTAMIEQYLRAPQSLDRGNYPVVAMEVVTNPWFSLTANCWIPLPDRNTNMSTKAIHHHGNLLLTTVTLFGPGYEHWTFTTPSPIDPGRGLFRMELIEAAAHPRHHVAFVDRWLPHTPFYPPDLSITLALFSNSLPTSWRDRLKRLPIIRGREKQLGRLARRLGLARALDVKIVESFDFYPVRDGFAVMREREEFRLGPNADHVASVFHILQRTGNQHLASVIQAQLDQGSITAGRPAVEALLPKLIRDEPIEPRLSSGHYDKPYANFSGEDIRQALGAGGPG